jgi:hypothetical protein
VKARALAALPLLLFLASALAYLANGRTVGSGDTLPARYLPFSLLRAGDLDLDEFPFLRDEAALRTYPVLDGIPYFLRYRDGHYLSAYTPGPAYVALPVYAVPVLAGLDPSSPWVAWLEKLTGTLVTALSVAVLFQALARVASPGWAVTIAAVYALGTSSLSVSSQGLWQHGPSQLFVALLVLCLVRGLDDQRYLGRAGFAAAGAVLMRSTNVLLVLPVVAYLVLRHRRALPAFALWALPPAAAIGLYDLLVFHGGGIGSRHAEVPTLAFFTQTPFLEGVAGVLVSPGRGLLVYSPVLVFALAGAVMLLVRGPALLRPLVIGPALVTLAIGKWFMWWGGYSWGPRLLADTLPIACFLLSPVTPSLDRHRLLRGVFAVLAVVSVAAHALGAFVYDGRWDAAVDVDRGSAPLWWWRDGPLVFYGRDVLAGLAGAPVSGARAVPTGADGQGPLGATYTATPVPGTVVTGEPVDLAVLATNTGRARWLARTAGDRGAVRLGWRWYREGVEVEAGRASLPGDVAPGGSVRFTPRLVAPATPGRYTLVLDLVSEHVTWFADRGAAAVTAQVDVARPDLGRLVDRRPASTAASPRATIATDQAAYRPGQPLGLAVELLNPHRPGRHDAYLVLRGPGGLTRVHDGHQTFGPAEPPWPAWVKGLPLPAVVRARFTLPLASLPAGAYTWAVVLTEPGTTRVVASATAAFAISP